MKYVQRLAAFGLSLVLCLGLLTACGQKEEQQGQSLSVSVGGEVVSLDPIYAEEPGDQSILVQLYENLMRVSVDGSGTHTVINGMAKSVSQDQELDGSVVYTFKLRRAKWSDGEEVKAQDFVYAWRRLADPASGSPYAALLSVVAGYQEAREGGDMSLLQVTAKNDSTLVVRLTGRYDWFLTEVCTSPATLPLREDVLTRLKEANRSEDGTEPWWSKPAALVTNGPYLVDQWTPEENLTVKTSPLYEGYTGPAEVDFRFAETAEEAWKLYQDKQVDLVWPLPEEELSRLLEKEKERAMPELGVYTVLFNYQKEELADPFLRAAMDLAIDRTALAQAAGASARPAEGLIPPGVPEDESGDFRTVGDPLLDNEPESMEERQAQAVEQMRQMEGGVVELEYLYAEEGNHQAVAQALCQRWEELLHIQVKPRGVTEAELWTALRTGDYQLAGVELTAPGNDAECFLMQWTAHSHDNLALYDNSAYDTLMKIIATASSPVARMGCLHDAEALLLGDHVLSPLYTRETLWALRDGLTGLCRDPRGWFSFAGVHKI